jgi:hypothetical protein
MPEQVGYSMELSLGDSPSLSGSAVFEAEANDFVDKVTVPKNSSPKTINLQPSGLAEVKALMITSSNYTGDVSFVVDGGEQLMGAKDEEKSKKLKGGLKVGPSGMVLKAPLLLIGPDQIGLLGATLLNLTFTNANTTTDATVSVLVVRTAIEPGA